MRRVARMSAVALAALAVAVLALVAVQHLRLSGGPAPGPVSEGALRVATHNVHYIDLRAEEGPWSVAGWKARREALAAAFAALDADAVAFQEMESWGGGSRSEENLALTFLLERFPGYAAAAQGDPAAFPSTQPILYRTDRLEMLDQGWFFFSETPERLYSRGFDGAPPSFTSWAVLRDRRGGADTRLVNVHVDAGSRENRRRSAALVGARVRGWIAEGERVVLVGDLNALEGFPTLRTLEEAGLVFPPVPGATFHFNSGLHLFGAIDRVGLGPGLEAAAPPAVLRAQVDGAWPSDHHPVALDIHAEPR